MGRELKRGGQRYKATKVLSKPPERRFSENALGIYYGKDWRPSPVRAMTFPMIPTAAMQATMRMRATSTSTSASTSTAGEMEVTAATNFSRHRGTPYHQQQQQQHQHHLTKLPMALLHRQQRAVIMENETIEVWDGCQADQEFGRGLQIQCLAGGMGIGVHGRYERGPKAGQVRYDAFLAHLVEGRMEDTMLVLQAQVEEARKKGLVDIKTVVCYRDDKTLNQDPRMIWNSQMVAGEQRLNERFIQRVEMWWGPPLLRPYHVLDEKAMCITSPDRIIKVTNI